MCDDLPVNEFGANSTHVSDNLLLLQPLPNLWHAAQLDTIPIKSDARINKVRLLKANRRLLQQNAYSHKSESPSTAKCLSPPSLLESVLTSRSSFDDA
jgi:hypothetical protein